MDKNIDTAASDKKDPAASAEQQHIYAAASGASASPKFSAELQEDYKIGDKIVRLPGGFQRNEPKEDRKVFPAPDLKVNLVPKDSPDASKGTSPRSAIDTVKQKAAEGFGNAVEVVIRQGSKVIDNATKDKPWDDYGKDRSPIGRVKDLSRDIHRRFELETNLQSSYPPNERSGKVPDYLASPREAEVSRMPDGTGNNLGDPAMGAAGTRFQYNTKPDMRYAIDDPPLMDAARLLDRKQFKELPVLNVLGAFNLQENVHDWMDHGRGQNVPGGYWKIALPPDHPIAKYDGQKEMLIPKLLVDGTRTESDGKSQIRQTYENTVTHWWDGSEIYGSDAKTADRLRSHDDGKLRLTKDGLLPMGPEGVPDTGFNQNWNPGLEVTQTLYAREHNSICDMLVKDYPKDDYPNWKNKLPEILHPMFGDKNDKLPEKLSDAQYDEFIYSRARLINAAEKAKIHTIDWTPIALNNPTMTEAMIHNYGQEKFGIASKIDEHEIGGIWGHKTQLAGKPYAMEEDFVQSYQQMHGLVPDNLQLFDHTTGKEIGNIPMGAALQGNSRKVIDAAGFDNVLYSMTVDRAGAITAGNHPNFMRDLNMHGNYIDLAAVDILRGREKHLPRYNEYLREMHEKPVKNFEELIPNNKELREQLRKVYNNDIEKVDTVIGSLSEWPDRTPKTMGFSTSTFLEFILMASRRVQADRFYTTDFRPEIYTPEGIARVRGLGGMKDIIDRNAPALKSVMDVRQSAFHPIGTVVNGQVKLGGPIPLNNSGIDMIPTNDLQRHVAAFDTNQDGEVSLKELRTGFEAIGYNPAVAEFKAGMARARFGSVIADIKPTPGGMYKADGNLDLAKVDGLFDHKNAITRSDVNDYLKARHLNLIDRTFINGQFDSGFQSVGKDSITKDEFVKIMNGEIMKEKIAAAAAKKSH